MCTARLCVFCRSSRQRFIDDEADASVADSDDDEGAAAVAAGHESLGSLADFIAEPSEEEMAQAGLAFDSDDDCDPLAVLRDARPFQAYRRMGAGGAAAAEAAPQQRRREPKPAAPELGASTAALGDSAGVALLQLEYGVRLDSSFVASAGGCDWLTDVGLLCDGEKSHELYDAVLRGYAYDKTVKRQAKPAGQLRDGLQELTACADYCTHILAQRLGLLWSGGAPVPGVQVAGCLMLPDPAAHGMVCIEVAMHGKPLELATALLQLVLGHPANKRWRDIVVGRKFYKSGELVYLTQVKVRYKPGLGDGACIFLFSSFADSLFFCLLLPVVACFSLSVVARGIFGSGVRYQFRRAGGCGELAAEGERILRQAIRCAVPTDISSAAHDQHIGAARIFAVCRSHSLRLPRSTAVPAGQA